MPWQEVKPMDQKILFIADHLRNVTTFSKLCQSYGISRKTGYKWLDRYRKVGLEGLHDQSRKPHSHPLKTPFRIRRAIIELRTKHRDNPGAKKIHALLKQKHPDWHIPTASTIHRILVEQGLVTICKQRRRRVTPQTQPFSAVKRPNDVWSADFKGQFRTGDGQWSYPLTIMDHHSRYLLACQHLKGTETEATKAIFAELFHRYGLPKRIRTDNGSPFASTSVAGLSQLSKWWVRLGITPERIEPGKPQQNGRHERMHHTLKLAAINPAAANATLQQKAFDSFVQYYNNERPHESLGQKPPASCYTPSSRNMPDILPEFEYPGHFQRYLVNHNGIINHLGHRVYLAGLLRGEYVGLEQVSETQWLVYLGAIKLGRFDMDKIRKAKNDYIRLDM